MKASVSLLIAAASLGAPNSVALHDEVVINEIMYNHQPVKAQPEVVADSLEDYLQRHPRYVTLADEAAAPLLLTSGNPDQVSGSARVFWAEAPGFQHLPY